MQMEYKLTQAREQQRDDASAPCTWDLLRAVLLLLLFQSLWILYL